MLSPQSTRLKRALVSPGPSETELQVAKPTQLLGGKTSLTEHCMTRQVEAHGVFAFVLSPPEEINCVGRFLKFAGLCLLAHGCSWVPETCGHTVHVLLLFCSCLTTAKSQQGKDTRKRHNPFKWKAARCWHSCSRQMKNCTELWLKFRQSFAGKSHCSTSMQDFGPFVDSAYIPVPKDKVSRIRGVVMLVKCIRITLKREWLHTQWIVLKAASWNIWNTPFQVILWTGTYAVVGDYASSGKRFYTISDSLIGLFRDTQFWVLVLSQMWVSGGWGNGKGSARSYHSCAFRRGLNMHVMQKCPKICSIHRMRFVVFLRLSFQDLWPMICIFVAKSHGLVLTMSLVQSGANAPNPLLKWRSGLRHLGR